MQKNSSPAQAFWKNLSKVWLTKRALRELDKSYDQSTLNPPHPQYQRARRPVTRSFAKSQVSASNVADLLLHCEPRNIKLFARYGGPDLSDLRGYPELIRPTHLTMSRSPRKPQRPKRGSASTRSTRRTLTTESTSRTEITNKTKGTGVYDRNFLQNLIDFGMYPDAYEYPDGQIPLLPRNWAVVNQKLAQTRPSLSSSQFSDEDFRAFKRADAHAAKEKQVSESVIPLIAGKIKDAKCVAGGVPFGNLEHLTDGTLKPGNPDLYYGARPEKLDRQVRAKLGSHIVPSTQDDLPVAPNFFLAAKGPDGSLAVAGRQACYDGALGARGMHSLHSHNQDQSEPAYDNNAYTITSIYHGGTLKMYTSHPSQPGGPDSRPEYYMNQIKGYAMTSDTDTFRRGATAFRNLRDWAEEQRNAAILHANEAANKEAQAMDEGNHGRKRKATPKADGPEPKAKMARMS